MPCAFALLSRLLSLYIKAVDTIHSTGAEPGTIAPSRLLCRLPQICADSVFSGICQQPPPNCQDHYLPEAGESGTL